MAEMRIDVLRDVIAGLKTSHRENMLLAAELGYRCCEKGMNLQASMAKVEETLMPAPSDALAKAAG